MVRRLIWRQKAKRSPPFPARSKDHVGLSGISTSFEVLSQIVRQIIYALLTRAPLNEKASSLTPFDLHVLGTPPAFVLSQDQTLQFVLNIVWYTYQLKNLLLAILIALILTIHLKLNAIRFSKTRETAKNSQGCKQTDNIIKSIHTVNNYFQERQSFFR